MGKKVTIFMFIDALGWEIVKEHNFCTDKLPHRFPVKMQLGYSSTAIPTILSGKKPKEHKHFSFFYYSPKKSPFKIFKYLLLRFLPPKIFNRWRVRHFLSKIVKAIYGFTGYFELYNVSYAKLPYFDYCEKKDIFAAGGLYPVKNLCDVLNQSQIPYLISDWRKSDYANIVEMQTALLEGNIEFGFLYTASLDGFLHNNITDSDSIGNELFKYEQAVEDLMKAAADNYDDFNFMVISDHGMTPLNGLCDLKPQINKLNLKFGKDYVAVFDSTMARFWFLNDNARKQIMEVLETVPNSRILSSEEKEKYGIDFENNLFGEEMLLLDPGYQIIPSDMGLKPLSGMHGYAPEDKDSFACILSNKKLSSPPEWVGDFFGMMTSEIKEIQEKNQ
jgi:hypothetical protein